MSILEQIYFVLEANKNVELPAELANKLYRVTEDYKKGVEEFLKDDPESGLTTKLYFNNKIVPNYESWVNRLPRKPKYK